MIVIKNYEQFIEWVKKYKCQVCCLGGIVLVLFVVPLLIVHGVFQWNTHIPWFEAKTWSAGDVLSYTSGFMTLIGTIILGVITVYQSKNAQEVNKRLAEQNNQLQQIMAQNFYPIITMDDAHMTLTEICDQQREGLFWCSERKFGLISYNGSHGTKIPKEYSFELQVNYDNSERYFKYRTEIMFNLCNASSSIITQIQFNHIQIWGGSGFAPVDCINTGSMTIIRTLLRPGEKLKGKITIFFNNEMAKEQWNTPYGGIGMEIDITNTTITDIKFKEHIDLSVSTLPGNDNYEYSLQ